jgi:hypothetical protein
MTAAGALVLAAIAGAATAGSLAVAAATTLLLAAALVTGRTSLIASGLLLLGAIYVIPEGDRSIPAPLYGGALLLVAELAFWSLDERGPRRVEPRTAAPRLLGILAVVAVGIAAGALVLLASETDVARSTGRTAAGLCAILACIAVLAALARRSASPLPASGASSRADEA